MAKYHNVEIGHYRRRDGTKIKAHTRKVKSNRGLVSRYKEKRNEARGKLRKALRESYPKTQVARLKARVRTLSQRINSVRRGQHKYKHGVKYQKRNRGRV